VANFIKLLFLENNLVGHRYVEPYAGGASVALSLLYEEYASHIHINDLNRSVFAFWDAVLNATEDLCRRVTDTPIDVEQWEIQRRVQLSDDPDPLDLAFSTFFLSRTNRSGIIWTGGIIGGKKQQGKWKLDARYNRVELVRRIEKVARYRSRITITRQDAAQLLQETIPALPENTFVYLDPPYYLKGEDLYQNYYQHADHEQIARLVQGLQRPWLVSYDAAPEILAMYEGFPYLTYALGYSAAEVYEGQELMFFSEGLVLPDVVSPAKIGVGVVDRLRLELWQAV
jgi:DNA adenine methylase